MTKEKETTDRPILQFSVLCDGVATPQEMHNKPVFIGIFSSFLKPMMIPQFFIVNRWINGTGEHTQMVKVLDPDLKEITKSQEQKFNLPTKVSSVDLLNAFVNLQLPRAGVYWIKIELDGGTAMSYPVPVFEGK